MKLNLKNAVLKGTIILTFAGILSRIIGFFYRIFLTRTLGAANIGLIQLIMPLIGICFALCSSGIQTAISKYTASDKHNSVWLAAGLCISLPMTLLLSVVTYCNSDFIAHNIFLNDNCSDYIRMLAVSFTFSSFHNCINGYYFGCKKAGVPAFSQLFEQIIRVACVYLYTYWCNKSGICITAMCAVYGNIAGEIGSTIFCCIALKLNKNFHIDITGIGNKIKNVFYFSLPLTSNRLLMNLLAGAESILIPAQLILYGFCNEDAISYYGILTGMALPLILFPSAITNSLSVMLLPEISQAFYDKNDQHIRNTFDKSFTLCMFMGIMSSFLFLFYGADFGVIIFNEPMVYWFIMILAWLCPFYYASTTLCSILNGLGKTTITSIQNTVGILIRITSLIILVPQTGITGYLAGILVSQISICIAHYIELKRMFHCSFNAFRAIIRPFVYSGISIGISLPLKVLLLKAFGFPDIIAISCSALLACVIFSLLVKMYKS